MPTTRRLRLCNASDPVLSDGLRHIQRELKLPRAFPPEVEAAAADAARHPRLPELDRTDIPLVTIDPAESMDLDQALHVAVCEGGYRVFYAIADVAAFVSPGDAVDREAHLRGESLYGADAKIPLHPKVLSEDAASLLPDQLRPALLWTIDLDLTGAMTAIDVRRARVCSRARLDYDGVHRLIDAGQADEMWEILQRIGELRQQCERERGGISLPLPEQEIDVVDGRWTLDFRARLPVEDWNEQISLLIGMAAARLMIEGRIGLLRTLPEPDPRAIERLRLTARGLGIDWPAGKGYPAFIHSLDPTNGSHLAMLTSATAVLRGAGYAAFNGELPEQPLHSALATSYSHATAPLRRLVDRYVGEVCLALCAGHPVPDWAAAALPRLPATMQASDLRAHAYENAVLNLAEAAALSCRVGDIFEGTIVEVDGRSSAKGVIMVREPAVESALTAASPLPLGQTVAVTLAQADPSTRTTRFEWNQ